MTTGKEKAKFTEQEQLENLWKEMQSLKLDVNRLERWFEGSIKESKAKFGPVSKSVGIFRNCLKFNSPKIGDLK